MSKKDFAAIEEARQAVYRAKVRRLCAPATFAVVWWLLAILWTETGHPASQWQILPIVAAVCAWYVYHRIFRMRENQLATAYRQWRRDTRARWGLYD